jgi:hypothetical protein
MSPAGGDAMSQSLTDRYDDRIAGVLSCYDRVVITGTLPTVCYAEGMTRFLYASGIRIFDYPAFAQTLRDRVRDGPRDACAMPRSRRRTPPWSITITA